MARPPDCAPVTSVIRLYNVIARSLYFGEEAAGVEAKEACKEA